jgi:hypothetical protein
MVCIESVGLSSLIQNFVSDHTVFHNASATAVRWMEMWTLEFNTVWNVVHCYPFEILNSSVILSCWCSLNCCTSCVWCFKQIICIAVKAQVRHGEPITGICAVVMEVCYKREEICVCVCVRARARALIFIKHFCGSLPEMCCIVEVKFCIYY